MRKSKICAGTTIYIFCNRLYFQLRLTPFLRCTVTIKSFIGHHYQCQMLTGASRDGPLSATPPPPHFSHNIGRNPHLPLCSHKVGACKQVTHKEVHPRRCHACKVTSRNKTTCGVMLVNQTLELFLQLNWLCTANVEADIIH